MQSRRYNKHSKDISLEALRGLAAVSVLFWHNMLGFFPENAGAFPNMDAHKAINTSVFFGFINGLAAVVFFFVLSGFVLTRHFFITGDPSRIFLGALKRWPRLALPVLIMVLISWLLFKLNLYFFPETASITQSPWLAKFAYAYETPFQVDFLDALKQGLYLTFFRGNSYYDSSLWTMRYEFIGSFAAFGLALIVYPTRSKLLQIYVIAIAIALCHFISPWYAAFPVGVALAALLPRQKRTVPLPLTVGMVVLAMYLAGYSESVRYITRGAFWLVPSFIPAVYVNIVGAVTLLQPLRHHRPSIRCYRRAGVRSSVNSLSLYTWFISPCCVRWGALRS